MVEIIKSKKDIDLFFKQLEKRNQVSEGEYSHIVKSILKEVKEQGDTAVEKYTRQFDDKNFSIKQALVSKEEQRMAFEQLSEDLKRVLYRAKERIYSYHCHQKRESWIYEGEFGEQLGQKITPLKSVGVYVPGGKAAYPSSVLMNVLPAKVAGVERITMVTPAVNGTVNPLVLAAAYVCEVDFVYKIGGAQAIGALAYGTETIQKVDKIVGPGNIFVALAKKEVYGVVGIDSIAGPSEICIIGNHTSKPNYVAADMLGQAEHDELASSVLFITDETKAIEVKKWVEKYYETSNRKSILDTSLTKYSKIIVVPTLEHACELANRLAPEHLELAIDEGMAYVDKIKNAGAIFIGHYTPEAFGDYMAGPNHVLPTVQTARFFSPLGVDDFIKKSSLISFTKEAALQLYQDVDTFAMAEGLEMHALSARIRGE